MQQSSFHTCVTEGTELLKAPQYRPDLIYGLMYKPQSSPIGTSDKDYEDIVYSHLWLHVVC